MTNKSFEFSFWLDGSKTNVPKEKHPERLFSDKHRKGEGRSKPKEKPLSPTREAGEKGL
jgi:hypothetical protein